MKTQVIFKKNITKCKNDSNKNHNRKLIDDKSMKYALTIKCILTRSVFNE